MNSWTTWALVGVASLSVLQLLLLAWLLAASSAHARSADPLRELIIGSSERLGRELRDELVRSAGSTRSELAQTLALLQQAMLGQAGDAVRTQNEQIDTFRTQLAALQQAVAAGLQQSTLSLAHQGQANRDAQDSALRRQAEANSVAMQRLSDTLAEQVRLLSEANERRLAALQDGNEKKLEQMRATVDEKLHATLEHRLGESFKQVAERLEQVHKGLGEMHTLARDVGSLSRVLNNVKSRGVFGEVQLAGLLEQVFTPEQYATNVETVPRSGARVEYAIRLPGRNADGAPLWLPIDAKFPREDYERLLDAQDRADKPEIEAAGRAIEMRLKVEARSIRDKYLAPPHTTDFAILFVPTEGLYAEALRRPGLVESLQRECKVMLAGPTTLLATLNSLQMGFRTLALEQRSAEVWEVLGAVKTEFAGFGAVLEKTRKKLDEAATTIDLAQRRTRMMTRKLKTVEALPEARAQALLPPVLEPTEPLETDADAAAPRA